MNVYKYPPKSHPRYLSLAIRDRLADGVKKGITSLQGLTAHGRGEAFDYLLGEKTHPFSRDAIKASAALLVLAKHPVLSINGNTATLAAKEFILLSKIINAPVEINLFHQSKNREKKIAGYLKKLRAEKVLLPDGSQIAGIESNRRMINKEGQAKADVVFVPLEDGDRTEALINMGKKVITVDLNPLSRTARKATITIVDNIVRAMPLLISLVESFKNKRREKMIKILNNYNNQKILSEALSSINRRLADKALKGV